MQLQTGSLYGTVTDRQGQGLPGVTVTLMGGGAPRVEATDDEGRFRFADLTPGDYTASAQLEGFAPATGPAVIHMGRTTEIAIRLKPAIIDEIPVPS